MKKKLNSDSDPKKDNLMQTIDKEGNKEGTFFVISPKANNTFIDETLD